ncbi:uncharacterized protein LOC128211904 [Mya arenaria]|uniref:uncharacterized protein LOC128211904 n=1 Tax=Mya arenaria TaxID=6604 RepID=UPI0022E4CE19|nr:uncharacterized protein LOC128211904 [Mya arenaria]XP_052772984.1 uncharacterized protein LOC128211904 [Mya arenaria]XP_052772985.1 uncharacterized protein LOC128211904 [Mya arenaria]
MPDTDNYYRLVTFIINTCASVLRRLFLEQARICAGTSFTTVQAYLRTRQRDIDKLKMKKIISKKQYELLFPSAVPVDENNWDISLLSVLIKNLYPTVQSTVITDVLAIRDVRNNMQHIANTAHISYSDFDKNWKALRSACLRIALFTKGRVYEEEIEKEIEASLTNSMPNLGDSLRQWYTREFAESLYKRIDELSEEIRELRKDTSKASATLNAVITKRPSATAHGKPFKRIKATTPISERPFDEFRKFMTTEMTPNIQPHVDCTEIKNRISTRRIAVITGYGGSHYIHTTAHAIRELNLKEELCTLITDPSDWKHINPMELQLVLFKCPFGDSEPNEEKARVMFDVMDSIKQTLLDDKCNMFVVVLSQTEVMRAAIEIIGKSHDLLEDPVTCHKENTKLDPDIIGQGIRSSVTAKGPNNISNLLELTDAYKTRLMRIDHMSPAVIEAKKQMKSSKVVLLTGKNQHDLTQVGLSLATSYNYGLSQFLIVRKSEELVNVPIKNISLLMIENLAGKYDYEKQRVSSWLEILEMLLSVVVKKQLKIVLTLESEKLTRCILDFKKEHEVFSYLVEVNPAAIRYIKDDLPAQQTPLSIRYCRAMLQQEVKPVTLTFVTDLRLLQEEKDEEESNITGMTVVEDRFLVATDWKKKCLRCFDIDIGKQIHRYTMEVNPCSITTLPDSRVAVTQNDDIHF